jgi:hypothetical protein
MAYMDQTKKAKIAPVVKKILAKYKLKGSLSVRNHMALCLKIKQGPIDFIKNFNDTIAALPGYDSHNAQSSTRTYIDINPYHFQSHFTGKALAAMRELYAAMMDGNHDNSDIMTDYFDVGWYIDINIGSWNAPYALVK